MMCKLVYNILILIVEFVAYRAEFGCVFGSSLVHPETHEGVMGLKPRNRVANQINKSGLMHRVPKKSIISHANLTFPFIIFDLLQLRQT